MPCASIMRTCFDLSRPHTAEVGVAEGVQPFLQRHAGMARTAGSALLWSLFGMLCSASAQTLSILQCVPLGTSGVDGCRKMKRVFGFELWLHEAGRLQQSSINQTLQDIDIQFMGRRGKSPS